MTKIETLTGPENEAKWRQLGDLALAEFDLDLSEKCYKECDDVSALLLLYTSQVGYSVSFLLCCPRVTEFVCYLFSFPGQYCWHVLAGEARCCIGYVTNFDLTG